MLKLIFVSSFFVIIFLGCQNNSSVEPYNYEKDTPVWLKTKIDSMSTNEKYYFGKRIYLSYFYSS